MEQNGQHKKIEDYRGYEIFRHLNGTYHTDYYFIVKDGERDSCFCLASALAARHVIDTHLRQKTNPMYISHSSRKIG